MDVPVRFIAFAAAVLSLAGCNGVVRDRIYQPPAIDEATLPLPAGAERIRVVTADGLALAGAVVPARSGQPTLLVFHGNASLPTGTLEWLRPIAEAGYGIVVAGYRGYGGNPGRPSEAGLSADADAFYAEARRRAGNGRVIVVGHSVGGGVAFGLAERERLDALVAIGTFTSMRAMAPRIARAFVADRYDNGATIARLDEPPYLAHGLADDVVPASEGDRLHGLAAAAQVRGGSFVIRDAGHRPDGASVLAIVDAVAARLDGGDGALPAGTRFVSF